MTGPHGVHRSAWSRNPAENRVYLKRRRLLIERNEWTGFTSSVGAQRRLQALARMGWSWGHLAVEAGYGVRTLQRFVGTPRDRIQAGTARRIAEVYDRLAMRPGPSRRAALLAERRGWPPPLAWDEDTIDDPAAKPYDSFFDPDTPALDEVLVERIMLGQHPGPGQGKRPVPERIEAIRRLAERGKNDTYIARRLGITPSGVEKLRTRNGIEPGQEPNNQNEGEAA